MSTKQFAAVIVSATVLLGFLAYANTFTGDWVWDDVSSVLLHENVQQPSQLVQLFREDQHAFGRGAGNFYRPLVSTSFMLDFWLSFDPEGDGAGTAAKGYADVKPFLFHLTNVLWHVAASVLLFFLLVRLQAPRMIQAVVPMLYVLHPMHTEAVAYISGRADMMSATFILAALLCATVDQPRHKIAGTVGSALFFILGLCSKESTMIYPVLLLLLIGLRPQPDGSRPTKAIWMTRALPLMVAAIILVGYGALRATVLKFSEGGGGGGTGLGGRLVETAQAFAFYIKTLFLPTGLHMEQTLAGTPVWTAALGLVCLVAIGAIATLTWRVGHYRISLGYAWFLAAWLPISGVFPLNAPMAEHWMYVPMAGFWWATLELVHLLAKRSGRRLLLPCLTTALALIFLYATVQRNSDWKSNESIFRATLAENPDTLRVHANLATTYDFLEGNFPGAQRHYEAVLNIYDRDKADKNSLLPEELPIRISLAEVLLRQGKYEEALENYARLLGLEKSEMKAEAGDVLLGYGECQLALGNYGAGAAALRRAAELNPALSQKSAEVLRGRPLPSAR